MSRLPASERRALRAAFALVDANNHDLVAEWDAGDRLPDRIEPIRLDWTPRLVGRWLWSRLFALSYRAQRGLTARIDAPTPTPEAFAETYRDEARSHVDASMLAPGWARHDPDATADLYMQARRLVEPFTSLVPSLALPALEDVARLDPSRTADVMGERLVGLLEGLDPYGATVGDDDAGGVPDGDGDPPARGDDSTKLVEQLSRDRKAMPAALVGYMADRTSADFESVARVVHGGSVSDGAIRSNVARANVELEQRGAAIRFRCAGGRVHKIALSVAPCDGDATETQRG